MTSNIVVVPVASCRRQPKRNHIARTATASHRHPDSAPMSQPHGFTDCLVSRFLSHTCSQIGGLRGGPPNRHACIHVWQRAGRSPSRPLDTSTEGMLIHVQCASIRHLPELRLAWTGVKAVGRHRHVCAHRLPLSSRSEPRIHTIHAKTDMSAADLIEYDTENRSRKIFSPG